MTGANNTEESNVVDPASLESAMIEKAKSRSEDPAEVAATLFTLYLPRFHAIVDTLSNKALRRLIKAIIEHPLEDQPYHLKEQEEKEAFSIALALVESKFVMIMNTYNDNLDTLVKASEDEPEVTSEPNNNLGSVNEGVNNG
jgi:hypothetical protein